MYGIELNSKILKCQLTDNKIFGNFGLNFDLFSEKFASMKLLIAVLLFCKLFTLCWPFAIGLFFILIITWILLLPFVILGLTIGAVFKIVGAIFMLPFKLLAAI